MNFQSTNLSTDESIPAVAHFLSTHPLTPPPLRKAAAGIAGLHPDVKAPAMNFSHALTVLRRFLDESIAARNQHPRNDLDTTSRLSELTVSTLGVCTPVCTMQNRLSFPVRSDNEEVAIRAMTADALSAAFTSPNKAVGEFASNFLTTVSGCPVLTAASVTLSPWTGDALKNAENSFVTMKSRADTVCTMSVVAETMQSTPAMRSHTSIAKIPHAAKCSVKLQDGSDAYYVLKPLEPKYVVSSVALNQAYTFMAASRTLRGTDKDHISPLTSGYYWMSCTRAINSAFCDTLTILDALHKANLSAIFFDTKPDMALMASLESNGVVVFYLNTAKTRRDTIELYNKENQIAVSPGIYPLASEDLIDPIQYMRYYTLTSTMPVVSKRDGVKYASEADLKYINETLTNSKKLTITQVYAADAHFNVDGLYVHPSARAHSGHILLSNTKLPDTVILDAATCASRIINANICKTWFPFTRTPFHRADRARYKIVFGPYFADNGFKIRMFEKVRRRATIDFVLDDGTPTVDDPDENMKMPLAFVENYLKKHSEELLHEVVIPPLLVTPTQVRHLPVLPAVAQHVISQSSVLDMSHMSSSTTTTTSPPILAPPFAHEEDTSKDVSDVLDSLVFDF